MTMTRRLFSTLRARLLALVLLAIVPALGMIVLNAVDQRRQATELATRDALQLARLAADRQRELVENAGDLLGALALVPTVRGKDPEACRALLRRVLTHHPHYRNLFVASVPNGDPVCSTATTSPLPGVAERPYFRRVLETRQFATGDYQISRITGRPNIVFARPVLGDSGQVEAVIAASVELSWLNRLAVDLPMPPGTTVTVTDRQGTIIARHPDPDAWLGRTLSDAPVFRSVLRLPGEQTFDATGLDGQRRLFVAAPLSSEPELAGFTIIVAIPADTAFAAVNRALIRNVVGLALVAGLALLTAWVASGALILRPLARVLGATRRLGTGDLTARSGAVPGVAEISDLAGAFDDMAEALEQRHREAETLLAVTDSVGSTLDLTEVMRRVARELGRLLRADTVGASMPTPDGTALQPLAGYHVPRAHLEAFRRYRVPLKGHAFLVEAWEQQRPVFSSDVPADPRIDREFVARFPHQSLLFVPLLRDGELLGGLLAIWWTERRLVATDDLRLAEGIGRQAALAVVNARLHAQTERRRREAEILAQLAQTISASLSLESVLQRVVEGARELCRSDTAEIALPEPGSPAMVFRYWTPAPDYRPHRVEPGKGAGGQAILTGRPFRTDNYVEDPRITKDYLTEQMAQGVVAQLVVPILGDGRVEGLLYVANRSPQQFTGDDEAVLQRLAEQAAVAIKNAHLYADAEQRRRAAESLAEVGRHISRSLDPEEVALWVADGIRRLLGALAATLYRLEPESGDLVALGVSDAEEVTGAPGRNFVLPTGTGLSAVAIREDRAVTTPDLLADPRVVLTPEARARIERSPYRATLAVPIRASGTVIGTLAVGDRIGRVFGNEDGRLAEAFADRAAIALENARHYEAAERRRQEAEVIAELARSINASLDLDTVLQRVTEGARELCHSDMAEIALWDPNASVMVFRYFAGVRSDAYRGVRVEPGKGAGGQVILTGRPFRTDNYAEDPRITKDYLAPAKEEGAVAVLIVPIRMDERVGLLYVESRAARRFTDEEEAILVRLAGHAAIAIGNARLFEESEGRRRASESLAEVAHLFSQSLDPREVARRIADSLLTLLRGQTAALYELDAASGSLVSLALAGEIDRIFLGRMIMPPGTGIAGLAVHEGKLVMTADILEDSRLSFAPAHRERLDREASYRAALAVPLIVKDRIVGALGIADRAGRIFTQDDMRLAQAFADQAAVALENARLFDHQIDILRETQRQHREAVALEAVARQLASSLEREEVLQRVVDNARDLCRCDLAFLAPYDPETETATISAATGARSQALVTTRIARGRGIGGQVLETGEPFATDDYLHDTRFTKDYADVAAQEGTIAQAVVPLKVRGATTGLLCVANRTSRSFAPEDIAILTKLADQAAGALENSRLYAERQQAEAELQVRASQQAAVAELGQRALAEANLDAIMDTVVRAVAETLGVELCQVLELLPDGTALRQRAGVGWKDGTVGHAIVGAGLDSQAGYTLLSDEPVVVGDLRTETRFSGPALLRDQGVVSGMSVVIRAPGRPFGVLGAYTARQRTFSQDDVHFLQAVANVLAVAIQRTYAEEILRRQAERLSILHEIDRAILIAQSPEAIARAALSRIQDLVPCWRASVTLLDLDAREGTVFAVTGGAETTIPTGTRHSLDGMWRRDLEELQRGRACVVDDVATLADVPAHIEALRRAGLRSYVRVPLLVLGGGLLGSLNMSGDRPAAFTAEHVDIAREVANSLAIAIQNAQLFEQVRDGRERLQALSRRLVEVQEAERRQIARELHDEIGQVLTGLKLILESSRRGAGARLDEARRLVDELVGRARELSLDLRPAMLDDLGLLPVLLWHVDRYTAQTGVRVRFEHEGLDRRFEREVETAAYRIVQEALTNVARHAGVQKATVRVWVDGESLALQVSDDGRGFDPGVASPTTGLAGMRERAALLGGRLTIESGSGGGTRITATLPVTGVLERRQAAR